MNVVEERLRVNAEKSRQQLEAIGEVILMKPQAPLEHKTGDEWIDEALKYKAHVEASYNDHSELKAGLLENAEKRIATAYKFKEKETQRAFERAEWLRKKDEAEAARQKKKDDEIALRAQVCTIQELAEKLGKTPNAIHVWIKRKGIQPAPLIIDKNTYTYFPEDFEEEPKEEPKKKASIDGMSNLEMIVSILDRDEEVIELLKKKSFLKEGLKQLLAEVDNDTN